MSNLGQGYWECRRVEALTQGTQGKKTEKAVAPYLISPASAPLPNFKAFAERMKNQLSNIQCMSQVTEWWIGCRDMLAQS